MAVRNIPPAVMQRAKHLFLTNKVKLSDQFGLIEQVSQPKISLPEFLFVGSTNVGKSSLLTSLLNPKSKSALKKKISKEVPRVSKRAGFTSTMSVYSIGKLLRLIDSPGYGFKSSSGQGDVVTKYLDVRGPLVRNAYILIHAVRGVSIQDREVSAILSQFGIPFQFVLTKCDLGGSPESVYDSYLELCEELHVPPADSVLQTSMAKDYGIDELRGSILELSGLLEAH